MAVRNDAADMVDGGRMKIGDKSSNLSQSLLAGHVLFSLGLEIWVFGLSSSLLTIGVSKMTTVCNKRRLHYGRLSIQASTKIYQKGVREKRVRRRRANCASWGRCPVCNVVHLAIIEKNKEKDMSES